MKRPFTTVLAIGAVTVSAAVLTAHAQELAFDGVSIRPNRTESTGGGGGPRPDGRFVLTNVPARTLISIAYQVPSSRIFGGPGWLATDRYDMAAIGDATASPAERAQMMRTMLRERFNLQARLEKRELPIYALVVARADGRLGPNIRPATVDCADPAARKQAAAGAPPGSFGACGFREAGGRLEGRGLSLDTLAQILVGPAGRPVLNRAGLTSAYDVELAWAATPDAADGVSIFTAVQEQLGLKLESTTAPLDAVVVERIDRPTEN